jgi:desulfoferrodoxin (superoxide reductase-like protein)
MYFKINSIITLLSLFALSCAIPELEEKRELGGHDSLHCESLHADFVRRQAMTFNSATVYDTYTAENNKHVPFIALSEDGATATVTVGDGELEGGVYHPMSASSDPAVVHYISDIYVVDENGSIVYYTKLDPSLANGVATVTFDVPEGVKSLTAYEWCNLHGLWKGPEVVVDATATGADLGCHVPAEYPPGSWESVRADFIRRQGVDFASPTPYTETSGVKHTPYITFDETGGLISVGGGDTIHPMTASSDASVVHFITEVLVEDQDGNIIFMKALDPTNVDSVSGVAFAIPEKTTSVTAYEFCNLHGYWKGPSYPVPELYAVDVEEETSDEETSPGFSKKFEHASTFIVLMSSIVGAFFV